MLADPHSLEYIAEHLPEVAMDNRVATLPLWHDGGDSRWAWQLGLQRVASGGLLLSGVSTALARRWPLSADSELVGFGYVDELRFRGSDLRPLDTRIGSVPLALPASARFDGLQGSHRSFGLGLALDRRAASSWLGEHQWIAGVMLQRVDLRGYRARYTVLDGPSAGAAGVADYSARYDFATPMLGLGLPRQSGAWRWNAHALLAVPLPRQGWKGRIDGPGFDIAGDTAGAGNGRHMGDVSLAIGIDATYVPWGVEFTVCTTAWQLLSEPAIHKGVDRNLLVSIVKRF